MQLAPNKILLTPPCLYSPRFPEESREHYGPSVLAVLEPILYYINIINSCVWSTQPRLYTFLLLARKHIIGVECVHKMFYLDYILQSRFIF